VLEDKTGLLVEPGKAESLLGAMRLLYADRDLARSMGSRGRSRVSTEFTRDRMVRETQDLYDFVLGARRS
jgi:glycosyltransferase involved in cell wall biosynthesis